MVICGMDRRIVWGHPEEKCGPRGGWVRHTSTRGGRGTIEFRKDALDEVLGTILIGWNTLEKLKDSCRIYNPWGVANFGNLLFNVDLHCLRCKCSGISLKIGILKFCPL